MHFTFVGKVLLTTFDLKLDGVGPVNNRPSTNKLYHFVWKKKKKNRWHMTCDMLHVTCDTWHVTCCEGWKISQNFSSLALTVCDLWYFKDLEEKDHWLTFVWNKFVCNFFVGVLFCHYCYYYHYRHYRTTVTTVTTFSTTTTKLLELVWAAKNFSIHGRVLELL